MPKSAHDHAVAEARMKQYAYLEDETGTRSYVRLKGARIWPLTEDDRAFLIEEGRIIVVDDYEDAEAHDGYYEGEAKS